MDIGRGYSPLLGTSLLLGSTTPRFSLPSSLALGLPPSLQLWPPEGHRVRDRPLGFPVSLPFFSDGDEGEACVGEGKGRGLGFRVQWMFPDA